MLRSIGDQEYYPAFCRHRPARELGQGTQASAILAADVVGYVRLMEQDEAATFERLRALRRELVEPPAWRTRYMRPWATAWRLGREAEAITAKSRLAAWLGHWVMAALYQWHKGDFDRSVVEAEAAVKLVSGEARSLSDLAM